MKGSFDCAICDPPFLSEDCHTKGSLSCVFKFSALLIWWLYSSYDHPLSDERLGSIQPNSGSHYSLQRSDHGKPDFEAVSWCQDNDLRSAARARSAEQRIWLLRKL